jgi:peptide subunit release factor RF-3
LRLLSYSTGKGKGKTKTVTKALEELEDEGLAQLIPDIQSTANLVEVNIVFLTFVMF